jgi:spore germination cell wall hydrolase CwlJ-like protein
MIARASSHGQARTVRRVAGASCLALVAAASAAGVISALPSKSAARAATVTVPITDARAEALINATAAPAKDHYQAIGSDALKINAALPFSRESVEAASPFTGAASAEDSRRALLCLTQAIYYEAGFEPLEGRRAVAQVVLNRLRHPAFPKSVCGVVYQGAATGVCQFTFVCDGSLNRRPALGAWREAETIALAALRGYVEPAVGESTFYHADYVAPRWAPLLTKVTQIGQHIFYRWPGEWGQRSAFTGRYIGEPRDPASLRPSPRINLAASTTESTAQAPAGPPVARAPDDVGGLLDTSKGWTLNIPSPDETGSSAARVLAAQHATTTKPEIAAAAPAQPPAAKPEI